MSVMLPVATTAQVNATARALISRHRAPAAYAVGLHVLAAFAGLAAPPLLGSIINRVTQGTASVGRVDETAALLAAFVILQSVLTFFARRRSFVLGEQIFAQLRESFLDRALALPLSTVERAGTGDLLARTTQDVDSLSYTVRFAVPEVTVASLTTLLTIGAAVLVDPRLALGAMTGLPLLFFTTKWYLARAPQGYLWERAAYAQLSGTVAETVDGARTVDALGLIQVREKRSEADLANCYAAERRTLFLRCVFFPGVDLAFAVPVAITLLWGGWLVSHGLTTVGAVTAVTLYVVQLADPLDRLVSWLDELQIGTTSLARMVGIEHVPNDREESGEVPVGDELDARAVRFAYRDNHDVLHGIDLKPVPGERLAIVGPSGAGKSTLGRLLAGIHPPRTGDVTVGEVPLVDLPLADLRGRVALVTQEHHVFVGSIADNLRLGRPEADDDALLAALAAVDARDWVTALPEGLDSVVGTGGLPLSPPQAQQVALARLVLADPHTLVLDEATSLIDPRSARHLERSLAGVLAGRTVVAIAHRLHTAHDADRVAVVEDGLISELGTHHELVAREGSYAALWRSWRDES